MSKRVLMVFSMQDGEWAVEIENLLRERLRANGDEPLVTWVRNEKDAMSQTTQENYALVISHVCIPADSKSSPHPDESMGLRFLQKLDEDNRRIPSILVGRIWDHRLSQAAQDLSECKFVAIDLPTWQEDLIRYATRLVRGDALSGQNDAEPQSCLHLDLLLERTQRIWYYWLKGENVVCEQFDWIDVDMKEVQLLVEYNEVFSSSDIGNWKFFFKHTGELLKRQIFDKKKELTSTLERMAPQVGGPKNIKIRFLVERDTHPIAFEALLRDSEDDYWMLRAPVYRKTREFLGSTYPLFQDRETRTGPINCMIIEAAHTDRVRAITGLEVRPGEPLTLKPIRDAHEEANWLKDFLKDKKQSFPIGEIEHIDQQTVENHGEGKSFSEYVQSRLKRRTWHLVHFCGHSHYDVKSKTGYLFFPGQNLESVSINSFGEGLKDTRFVFLSSCRGTSVSFVFELTAGREISIPALAGFAWDVRDDLARKYTKAFYKYLFERERSLEYAFLRARRKMYRDHGEEKIWAAPMLVMQASK